MLVFRKADSVLTHFLLPTEKFQQDDRTSYQGSAKLKPHVHIVHIFHYQQQNMKLFEQIQRYLHESSVAVLNFILKI